MGFVFSSKRELFPAIEFANGVLKLLRMALGANFLV